MKYFLIAFLFLLISCNCQKNAAMNATTTTNNVPEAENKTELLMDNQYGIFEEDDLIVVKDEKRLKMFFSKINRTRKPGLPVPEVDFRKSMLVIQCVHKIAKDNFTLLSSYNETDTQLVLQPEPSKKAKKKDLDLGYSSFRIYKIPTSEKQVTVNKGIK